MACSCGDADEVAGVGLDGEDRVIRAIRIDVENSADGEDEADLVLGVGVFPAEFGREGVEIGGLRSDVDDVGGGILSRVEM